MFDIGREGISFNGYGELGDVVKKFTNHPDICIVRIKDRLSSMEKTTPCGWADVMINFYFVDDPEHHIVEVQLFHDLMMQARGGLGGHEDYNTYRSILEIFEFNGVVAIDMARQVSDFFTENASALNNELALANENANRSGALNENIALANPEACTNPDLDQAAKPDKDREVLSGGLFADDDDALPSPITDLGEAGAQKRRRRRSRGASLSDQDRLPEAGDDDLGETSARERRRRPSRGSQSATARIIGRQLDSNPLDDESCPRV